MREQPDQIDAIYGAAVRNIGADGGAALTLGLAVRLRNDPSRWGVLEELIDRNGRPMGRVRMATSVFTFPVRELEPVPAQTETPLERLREGKLDGPDRLRRRLAHVRLSGRLSDMVYSLEATNTDFHAHQFKPVLKMLASPNDALLIADEVGLGKTIEAGLIWTELRARLDLRRLLVACPKVLCEKWREELVAPYNAQVNALVDGLPPGARVGTVDKFQGKEAAVCLVSMTSSSAEDTPRGLDFLFSLNRINVAISRAKALCLVFASPRLLEARCATVADMRLVNTLCALAEHAPPLAWTGEWR